MKSLYLIYLFVSVIGGDSLQLEDGQAVQLEDGTTAYIHTPKGKKLDFLRDVPYNIFLQVSYKICLISVVLFNYISM